MWEQIQFPWMFSQVALKSTWFSVVYFHKAIFIPTDLPSPPRTPSSTVQQYGRDSVTLTVQWQPPQYDGGAPVNYTITVSPGLGSVTTSGTSVPVTVPYNVNHTVSIVATNCNGNSSAAVETIPAIGKLQETLHNYDEICTFTNLLWPTFWAQIAHDYVSSLIFHTL